MRATLSESIKRPSSHKRLTQTGGESVFLLEKNLNTLKRQFLDLEVKMRQPKCQSFQPRAPEPRSILYDLNAKLFKEKENLEKKALSQMCENAKLEEKISDFKLKNNILNRELELEHSVNQHIVNENLEMKQSLEQAEQERTLLASRLTELKQDVEVIEKVEVQKAAQLLDAREEIQRLKERNTILHDRVQAIEKDAAVAKMSVEQLTREKADLQERYAILDLRATEKEKLLAHMTLENERLEKALAVSRKAFELGERHSQKVESEKSDLLSSLAKAYRQETDLMGEIAVLKAKVSILEQRNEEAVEQLWRITK